MRGTDGMYRLLKLGKRLQVWRSLNGEGSVCVNYENCMVKDGIFLVGEYGKGDCFYTACNDYCDKISGKTLVFDDMSDSREEVRVLF